MADRRTDSLLGPGYPSRSGIVFRATDKHRHRQAKEATAMADTPTDDQPGFLAKKPEHCFACYRLTRPGQTYYLTIS